VKPDETDQFLKAWEKDATYFKSQPGFISAGGNMTGGNMTGGNMTRKISGAEEDAECSKSPACIT
jgi:hypothetical protein